MIKIRKFRLSDIDSSYLAWLNNKKLMKFSRHSKKFFTKENAISNYKEIKKKIIYFPLHVQPEDTIDICGVKYNNQIETIRRIAMILPEDYTLVVKDHPGMFGIRGYNYLNKIKNLPNVKLINFRLLTDQILKKTSFVVTIAGTVLFEAAIKKINCIQLGRLGTTTRLPNVTYCENFDNIPKIILEKKNKIINIKKYDFYLSNYIYAGLKLGFDSNYVPLWEKNQKGDLQNIINIMKKEIYYYLKK